MSKKSKGNLNWFDELIFGIFDKLFGHIEKEEMQEENDNILGIKRFNLTWILVAIILIAAFYIYFVK